MRGTASKFRGVRVEVSDLPGEPREFLVKLTARASVRARKVGGESTPALRPAVVVVRVGRELEVVGYMPPEFDFPHLGPEDYERRALEEVRDHLVAAR
jgi:hypothetical protein